MKIMENKFRRPGNGEVCVQGISGLDENVDMKLATAWSYSVEAAIVSHW